MTRTIGIDLGTTYSAVAYINEVGKPEILQNSDGRNTTPSVVFLQDDAPLVGEAAKNSIQMAPEDMAQFAKRHMGDPAWRFTSSSGDSYRAEEISAIILRRLKADAELVLGEPVTKAVITVPAYFDDARRKATQDAGKAAGLEVARVLNEPTAAALAYGLDAAEAEGNLLVYDLGGGTFDVTVMRLTGGEFDVLATGGDPNLGGFNWDGKIMEWLNEQAAMEGGPDLLADPKTEALLRDNTERAKISLTSAAKTAVMLGAEGFAKKVVLDRETFDDLTVGLLGRTRDIMEQVLEESKLSWDDVDNLLLVGGSTRMPQVRRMVEEVSGKEPERSINPDEVVALGAAVQANLVDRAASGAADNLPELLVGGEPIEILDVTSQSLGTLAIDSASHTMMNSIIIKKNSKVPSKNSQVYGTIRENQERIEVEVTEGDEVDPDYVKVIGTKLIDLPPLPADSPIQIMYAYDIDQTVFVEVTDLTNGEHLGSFEVDRTANMSSAELDSAEQRIASLDIL